MAFLGIICALSVLLIHTLLLLLRRLYRQKVAEQSVSAQIPFAGVSRSEEEKIHGTAVICGGSVAGLLTARICHDHFDKVLIIEREAWLNTDDARLVHAWTQEHRRANVIQYYSLNGVLALSFGILKQLFPDLEEQCAASQIPIAPGNLQRTHYGYKMNMPSEDKIPTTMFTTRRGYETLLRRLILDKTRYPNIEQIVGTVTEIQPDKTNSSRVGSVSVRREDGDVVAIKGECFIDCTGSTQGLTWLEKAGYGKPDSRDTQALPLKELRISYDPKIRYSTLEFPVSDDLLKRINLPDERIYIHSGLTHPWKNSESVYSAKVDGNYIHLSAGSWGGKLPTDLDGFIKFAEERYKERPDPDYFTRCLNLLREVEDQMTYSKVSVPPRAYTRYHLASGLPSNWFAIGDSVMMVNPVFAQGTTKALIGAICLNALLHETKLKPTLPEDLPCRFFRLLDQKTISIWDDTRLSDYGHKSTKPAPGESLSVGWFNRWYGFRLIRVSFKDSEVSGKLTQNAHLVIPKIDLLLPSVAWKILWDTIVHPFAYSK